MKTPHRIASPSGIRFELNTNGSIRRIDHGEGRPLAGFTAADMTPLVGDRVDCAVSWKGGADVYAIAGKPVRLRFLLRDADVFAFRAAADGR